MPLESHRSKIAQHPGRRGGEPGHRAGIDEPGLAALDVCHLARAHDVGMTAADEVPVAGAGHAIAVLGVVHDENAAPGDLEARVRAVVVELPIALARPARERHLVAEVVAMDDVHRQGDRHRRAQGLRADHVAAMDHYFGALRFALHHSLSERIGAVVAVRDDADLQCTSGRGSGLTKPLRLGICTEASAGAFMVWPFGTMFASPRMYAASA